MPLSINQNINPLSKIVIAALLSALLSGAGVYFSVTKDFIPRQEFTAIIRNQEQRLSEIERRLESQEITARMQIADIARIEAKVDILLQRINN